MNASPLLMTCRKSKEKGRYQELGTDGQYEKEVKTVHSRSGLVVKLCFCFSRLWVIPNNFVRNILGY